jgi:hypothetical protein
LRECNLIPAKTDTATLFSNGEGLGGYVRCITRTDTDMIRIRRFLRSNMLHSMAGITKRAVRRRVGAALQKLCH